MSTEGGFFTTEMGAGLRQLRKRRGLTQAELAHRMGLGYRSGWSFVARLERGKFREPRLSTIVRYLKACGALMSEFFDQFNRIEYLPVEWEVQRMVERVPGLGKPQWSRPQVKALITQATKKQVEKYQDRTVIPLTTAPMIPEKQRKAAEGFRAYRVQLNIIEQAVKDMLEQEGWKAIRENRKPAVRYYEYYPYKVLARKLLSVLRKANHPPIAPITRIGEPPTIDKRLTTRSAVDQRRQAQTRSGASIDPQMTQITQMGNPPTIDRRLTTRSTTDKHRPTQTELRDKHEDTKTREAEGRQTQTGSEKTAASRPANPRKKTLEQRLTEVMRFVGEQQLNPEAAEKVREVVMQVYERLKV